jgi:hypothetical protein
MLTRETSSKYLPGNSAKASVRLLIFFRPIKRNGNGYRSIFQFVILSIVVLLQPTLKKIVNKNDFSQSFYMLILKATFL